MRICKEKLTAALLLWCSGAGPYTRVISKPLLQLHAHCPTTHTTANTKHMEICSALTLPENNIGWTATKLQHTTKLHCMDECQWGPTTNNIGPCWLLVIQSNGFCWLGGDYNHLKWLIILKDRKCKTGLVQSIKMWSKVVRSVISSTTMKCNWGQYHSRDGQQTIIASCLSNLTLPATLRYT